MRASDVYGKTLTFTSVHIFPNEAVFYIQGSEELPLTYSIPEEHKLYEAINGYLSATWEQTGHPFPVTIEFHHKDEVDINA